MAAVALADSAAPVLLAFGVGEELKFDIRWKAIGAGQATVQVRELVQKEGRAAYHVVCEAKSNGFIDSFFRVRDRFESWIDAECLSTIIFSKKISEGRRRRIEQTTIVNPTTGEFRSEKTGKDKKKSPDVFEGRFPLYVQDFVSTFFYVRSQPVERSAPLAINVIDGERVHRANVSLLRREKINTKAGRFDCLVVEALFIPSKASKRRGKSAILVWMTDDERRIPVKIFIDLWFGSINGELSSYKPLEIGPSPSGS